MRASAWLGAVVGLLGLAALVAAVVLPRDVVPDGESARIWLTLAGVVAAAGTLTARSWSAPVTWISGWFAPPARH
jgi:hypothetical protein